jgi:hypothetical protein
MRALAKRVFERLLEGLAVCVLPLTVLFSSSVINDPKLSPHEKRLAILATWRGRVLVAIDVCISALGVFAR